jgi:NAD(P)-dependent dehydrogenase (short-subunit alcohol dehydrogenase family)
MAEELRPHGIAALTVTPGFMRTEAMLDGFGVTEANWRDGAKKEASFLHSETPLYVGRAIAALTADPKVLAKSGGLYSRGGSPESTDSPTSTADNQISGSTSDTCSTRRPGQE